MVQDAAQEWQSERAANRGNHIDATKFSIGEIKLGAQLFSGQANEKGLPERREKGQQEAARYPPRIVTQKADHVLRLGICARASRDGLMPTLEMAQALIVRHPYEAICEIETREQNGIDDAIIIACDKGIFGQLVI